MLKNVRQEYFDNSVSKSVFDSMFGEMLGYGIGREVWTCKFDKTLVVKVEYAKKSFQNIHEWDLWTQLKEGGSAWANWLAPCTKISDDGIVLFQKRVKPVPYDFKLPSKIPKILAVDLKRDNVGIYKGRLVFCDYGRHEGIYCATNPKADPPLVKAPWIGAKDGYFVPPYTGRGSG